MNIDKVNDTAKFVQQLITASVKQSAWRRSALGEQPTRENIKLSVFWPMLGISSNDEADAVMDIVYPKLRKNGILAKLRGAEPAA